MGYRYLDYFRRGISVFAIFSYGIAVLGTPPMSPSSYDCVVIQGLIALGLKGPMESFPSIKLQSVAG